MLIAVNRVAASTKFLIDGVIAKRRIDLLLPLIGAVVLATANQGGISFVLTQSMSEAAQRLVGELWRKFLFPQPAWGGLRLRIDAAFNSPIGAGSESLPRHDSCQVSSMMA